MHPSKLVKEMEFVDIDYPGIITNQIKDIMKDVPPIQFLSSNVRMVLIKINYSYMTKRGNYRESSKYMFVNNFDEETYYDFEIQAQSDLDNWVEDYNKQYPYRAISNVEILGIEAMANANLKLQ